MEERVGLIMKKHMDYTTHIIIALLLTFIFDFGSSFINLKNGSVTISNSIDLPTGKHTEIQIENYSNRTIEGLKILVEVNAITNDIISSNPIEISLGTTDVTSPNYKIITLSSIPPTKITRVFIPVSKAFKKCCTIINYNELKLSILTDNEVKNIILREFYSALITVILYGIFLFIILKFTEKYNNKIREDFDILKKSLDEDREKVNEFKMTFARQKVILYRKLSDYSKELEFWRNTIRKILYNKHENKKDVEEIIEKITSNLETYSTHRHSNAKYEEIEALASHLNEFKEKPNS